MELAATTLVSVSPVSGFGAEWNLFGGLQT